MSARYELSATLGPCEPGEAEEVLRVAADAVGDRLGIAWSLRRSETAKCESADDARMREAKAMPGSIPRL